MANLRVKKELIGAVENQLRDNNPPCTKKIYEKLQTMGFSKIEAKEKIAAVLLEEMYYMIKDGHAYDEKVYENKLSKLVDSSEQEVFKQTDRDEDDPWVILEELIETGYKAAEKKQYKKMLKDWLPAWQQLKTLITDAENKASILEWERTTDYCCSIYGWLQDMELELENAEEHERRISFCKEVIELFSWESEKPDNYMAAVGESLNYLGKTKESDEWYGAWLKEEPDNYEGVASRLWCLKERNQINEAVLLLDQYIHCDTECNMKNEIMLFRAADIYEAAGMEEKATDCENRIGAFHKDMIYNPQKYGIDNFDGFDEDFFDEFDEDDDSEYGSIYPAQQPIVKEKKIYPNDLCPCQSGKKYKKCCGKV